MKVYRKGIPVEACTTLQGASLKLGGSRDLLRKHMRTNQEQFPSPVADIGKYRLYVFSELDAYYRSFLWRLGDRAIKELTGELDDMEGGDAA